MPTIYLRQGRRKPQTGDESVVYKPGAADTVKVGQTVAVVDDFQFGGNCIATGTVLEVFENSYLIRVDLLKYDRRRAA
jgi:hypothetical protein